MALTEAVILLIWGLLLIFSIFCAFVLGVICINALCLGILAVLRIKKKLKNKLPTIKIFDIIFAPAIWAINKIEEEENNG